MDNKLKAVVIGLRMGAAHAGSYAKLDEYELAGLCDIDGDTLNKLGDRLGCGARYSDYRKMLHDIRPDAVAVATAPGLHKEMTIEAIKAGARLVYCEKPIAVSLGDVLEMKRECERAGARLIIGHQRRVSAPYRSIREAITGGRIGKLLEIRATLPGDLLSDVTHAVDSILFFTGDEQAAWALGTMYRGRKAMADELAVNRFKYCGVRYGHNVEEGAMSSFAFGSGVRATIYSGTMALPGRAYQDIEIIGSEGRMHRAGDGATPAVMIYDRGGASVLVQDNDDSGIAEAHRLAAAALHTGADHPMDIKYALPGFEILVAIMESSRLRARINLPVAQLEYPLDIILREGGME